MVYVEGLSGGFSIAPLAAVSGAKLRLFKDKCNFERHDYSARPPHQQILEMNPQTWSPFEWLSTAAGTYSDFNWSSFQKSNGMVG